MLYQRRVGGWVHIHVYPTVQVLAANLCVRLICEPYQYEIIPVNHLPTTVYSLSESLTQSVQYPS